MEDTLRPKVSGFNYRTASLEMYQSDVLNIWPTNMSERPPLYIWLHVVRHASAACEGVRKGDWGAILGELAAMVLWWLAFIGKLNGLTRSEGDDVTFALPFTASRVVWNKYPNACPVEFGLYVTQHKTASWDEIWEATANKECTCIARKEEVENRSSDEKSYARGKLYAFAQKFRARKPRGLAGFEDMLRHIFSGPAYVLTPNEIAFHLMEEVGEVSRALADLEVSRVVGRNSQARATTFEQERLHGVLGLSEELADVFSWATSLIYKVRLLLSSFDDYFEAVPETEFDTLAKIRSLLGRDAIKINTCDVIWRKYGIGGKLRCSICGNRPCSCYVENQQLLVGEGIRPWVRETIRAVNRKLK